MNDYLAVRNNLVTAHAHIQKFLDPKKLRKLSTVYTLHSLLELGSLKYSSECEKKHVPVGVWRVGHCCSAAICDFTQFSNNNNIHYSTLMIFTAVW